MEEKWAARPERFVNYVFERAARDTGFAAKMRRADNPATEDQSWATLAAFEVDLGRDSERLPFAVVGAAICRSNSSTDGENGIGAALASSYEVADIEHVEKAAESRLRRLLACASTAELCQILRPVLRLVADKSRLSLSYARLLADMLRFESRYQEDIKKRWAMDFYGTYQRDSKDKSEG